MCVCKELAGRSTGRMLVRVCACLSAQTQCRSPTAYISSMCIQMVALKLKNALVGYLPPTGVAEEDHSATRKPSWGRGLGPACFLK